MKTIIIDIDSTLTNNIERERFATDHAGPENTNGKRNEKWHDIFQDGRLFHLDKPIIPCLDIMGRLSDQSYKLILVSGRRKGKSIIRGNHAYFRDWWKTHAYSFIITAGVHFRPAGRETDEWKLEKIKELAEEYEIVAGYGNERDMPIYEACGFEAILVDAEGNGWRMPAVTQ